MRRTEINGAFCPRISESSFKAVYGSGTVNDVLLPGPGWIHCWHAQNFKLKPINKLNPFKLRELCGATIVKHVGQYDPAGLDVVYETMLHSRNVFLVSGDEYKARRVFSLSSIVKNVIIKKLSSVEKFRSQLLPLPNEYYITHRKIIVQ